MVVADKISGYTYDVSVLYVPLLGRCGHRRPWCPGGRWPLGHLAAPSHSREDRHCWELLSPGRRSGPLEELAGPRTPWRARDAGYPVVETSSKSIWKTIYKIDTLAHYIASVKLVPDCRFTQGEYTLIIGDSYCLVFPALYTHTHT